MQRRVFCVLALALCGVYLPQCGQGNSAAAEGASANERGETMGEGKMVELPRPRTKGGTSLGETLASRRSVREFAARTLTWQEISDLLWAGQGITSPRGFRTAPSAGALYPLELYLVNQDGVHRYDPQLHGLSLLADDDVRPKLARAALGQSSIAEAPVSIVVSGIVARTAIKYGQRAGRYVALEAGAAGENILLQAVAVGLGGVWIGAFDDDAVSEIVHLTDGAVPFGILAIGDPALDD